MRREGYEFQVGKPRVLIREVDGTKMEPYEKARIDLPEDTMGRVIEFFSRRGAEISDMERRGDRATLHFRIPTRGLIGARSPLLSLTRGEGVLSSLTDGYDELARRLGPTATKGVLVSSHQGKVSAYALRNLEDRGEFFVSPGDQVYAGMVVGENNKDEDITLNVSRERKLTNVRSANKDVNESIRVARQISLEGFLEYLGDDELLEVTPKSLRLRKRTLDEKSRLRVAKRAT